MTDEQNQNRAAEGRSDSEALLERIGQLELRIAALEEAAKRNAPAMQAAWMHVPIGRRAF